jgi:transcriptional regulator with PAS, ATPase and Fis domain
MKHGARSLIPDALSATVGAALVLDRELRVELATREAVELLGFDVAPNTPAAQLLCGRGPRRPVIEALSEGRPVQALIARPSEGGHEQLLQVRSVPLGGGPKPSGWLLLLDVAASARQGAIEFHGMWTQSANMKHVFHVIERVAPEEATVLVRGETGSGKELVASAVHALSGRKKGPFRALNCAALPSNLLESELFGHARGAFTGAVKDVPGHVQLAHRGTLFLDEVAELPLELQAKLLRVIETRSVIPVGARDPVPVDVRIVSATHRSLRREVEQGRFRADLMYRLRVIPIFLPPLRERRQDIGLLCEKIFETMNASARRRVERISPSALTVLERHDWPGNVRELRNVLAYAYAIGDGPILQPNDLPPELLDPGLGGPSEAAPATDQPDDGATPEARRIRAALARAGGSRTRAAQLLGMSRVTLWRRMRELGVESE